MARKLAVGVNWQGKPDFKGTIEQAKIADAAGIHSIWVAEAWGRDAFTLLTLLAEHTSKIQLATSIVNIYSRTPAALAQHFGTLDEPCMTIGVGGKPAAFTLSRIDSMTLKCRLCWPLNLYAPWLVPMAAASAKCG